MPDVRLLLKETRYLSTRRSRMLVASVFVGCWLLTMMLGLTMSPCMVVLPLLLISVATDTTWKFIPNWLTGFSAMLALGLAYSEGGAQGAFESLKGLSMIFAISLVLYIRFGLGAGDVKLCACLGACLGPAAALSMLLWSYSLSGIFPLCRIAFDRFQPVLFYGCSLIGLDALGAKFCRSDIQSYLRHQQPMAGWFAAGTFLTLSGAVLI
jgi:Flp pilus assembly protein protease CpaA